MSLFSDMTCFLSPNPAAPLTLFDSLGYEPFNGPGASRPVKGVLDVFPGVVIIRPYKANFKTTQYCKNPGISMRI